MTTPRRTTRKSTRTAKATMTRTALVYDLAQEMGIPRHEIVEVVPDEAGGVSKWLFAEETVVVVLPTDSLEAVEEALHGGDWIKVEHVVPGVFAFIETIPGNAPSTSTLQ